MFPYFCLDYLSTDEGGLLKSSTILGTILIVAWVIYIWIKKQKLETYMEQPTTSKLRMEYDKAIYFHPAYFMGFPDGSDGKASAFNSGDLASVPNKEQRMQNVGLDEL